MDQQKAGKRLCRSGSNYLGSVIYFALAVRKNADRPSRQEICTSLIVYGGI